MDRSEIQTESQNPVHWIADEVIERRKRGENPNIDEYCERFPDYAAQLREFLPALLALEYLKPASNSWHGNVAVDAHPDQKLPRQIGDFHILAELGRGGMGVVYEAEQISLGRRVALKLLARQTTLGEVALTRFEREARVAAQMHHTNIVPVFDVGADDNYLYYAMQLIRGQSLDLVIKDLRGLRNHSLQSKFEKTSLQPIWNMLTEDAVGGTCDARIDTVASKGRSKTSSVLVDDSNRLKADGGSWNGFYERVARIGYQVADGLAYAHNRGFVHRDIKPSNLLLDDQGIAWIADFGLAKTEDLDLTRSGDVPGTMRYMPPERFGGKCDARSDVYSLGLTLYELVTLEPAFSAEDRFNLIDRILKVEPPPPRTFDRRIPSDFETIILKSMEKDPHLRYQSAEVMAADLLRFINDEPIRARRASYWDRCRRWSRRNKGLAAALAGVAALLLVVTISAISAAGYFHQLHKQVSNSVAERNVALKDVSKLLGQMSTLAEQKSDYLYASQMQAADQSCREGAVLRCRELLDNHIPQLGEEDRRDVAWHFLNKLSRHALDATTMDAGDIVTCLGVDPTGRLIAASGDNALIQLFDRATSKKIALFNQQKPRPDLLLFGQQGNVLISVDRSHYRVWRLHENDEHSTQPQLTSEQPIAGQFIVGISSQHRYFYAVIDDQRVHVWDLNQPHLESSSIDIDGAIRDIKSLGDGGEFIAALNDGSVVVFAVDGTPPTPLPTLDLDQSIKNICVSDDGGLLVVATASQLQIHKILGQPNQRTCEAVATINVPTNSVEYIQPLRSTFAVASSEQITLYNYDGSISGRIHRTEDEKIARNANGDLLTLYPCDNLARTYASQGGELVDELRGNGNVIYAADFTAEGELITGGRDRKVRIFKEPAIASMTTLLSGHDHWLWSVAFSPDGKQLATSSYDGRVMVWDAESGEVLRELKDHRGSVQFVNYSPDGHLLATASRDRRIKLWNTDSWTVVGECLGHDAGVNKVKFSPGGDYLVSAGDDGKIIVWETPTQKVVAEHRSSNYLIWSVAFSRSGEVVFGGTEGKLYRWHWSLDEPPVAVNNFDANITSTVFSPDGKLLACTTADGVMTLYDYPRMKIVSQPTAHFSDAMYTAFSLDGKSMLTVGADGYVQFWSTKTLEPTIRVKAHSKHVHSVAIAGEGSRFATASHDNAAKVWTVK